MEGQVRIGCMPPEGSGIMISNCVAELCSGTSTYTMKEVARICPTLGFFPDVVTLLLEIAGIPLTNQLLIPTNTTKFGAKVNGSWNGIIRLVENGYINTSFPTFTTTPDRLQDIDFSYPVVRRWVTFATRMPKHDGVHLNPMKVFSPSIWLSFLVLGLVLSITLALQDTSEGASKSLSSVLSQKLSCFIKTSLDVIFLFTGQASIQFPNYGSTKISVGIWALVASVLAGLYTGFILVNLIQVDIPLPFSNIPSLAQCVSQKQCYIFIDSIQSATANRLINSRALTKEENELKMALIKNPIRYKTNVVDHIFSSSKVYPVFIGSDTYISSLIYTNTKHSEPEFLIIKSGWRYTWCFPTQKGSNLTDRLSKAVVHARQIGLYKAVYRKYFSQLHRKNPPNPWMPLNVTVVTGTMFLLLCGASFGVLAFLVELGAISSSCTHTFTVSLDKLGICRSKLNKLKNLINSSDNVEQQIDLDELDNYLTQLISTLEENKQAMLW